MRRPFACLLAACALPLFAAFELFDKPPVQGILRDGAALAAGVVDDVAAVQIHRGVNHLHAAAVAFIA